MTTPTTATTAAGAAGLVHKLALVLLASAPAGIAWFALGPAAGALGLLWPIGAGLCAFRGPGLVRRAWERNIADAPEWLTDEYASHADGGRIAVVEQDGAVALIAGHTDNLVAIVSRGYVRELDRHERAALWARLAHEAAGASTRRQRASTFADPIGALCRAYTPNLGWLQHAAALIGAPWAALVHRVAGDETELRDGDIASVGSDRERAAALASAYRRGMGAQMRLRSGGLALVGADVHLGERAIRLEVMAGNRMHTHGPVHGGMGDSPLGEHTEFEVVDLEGPTPEPEPRAPEAPRDAPQEVAGEGDDFSHLVDLTEPLADPTDEPVHEPAGALIRIGDGTDLAANEPPEATDGAVVDADFTDEEPDPEPTPRARSRRGWFARWRSNRRASERNCDAQLDAETTAVMSEPVPEPAPEALDAGPARAQLTAGADTSDEPDAPEGAPQDEPRTDDDDHAPSAPDTPAAQPEPPAPSPHPAPEPAAAAASPRPVIAPGQRIDLGPLDDAPLTPAPAIIPPPGAVEWDQQVRPWTELAPKPQLDESAPNRGPVSWDDEPDTEPEQYRDPLGALLRRRRSRSG